MRSVVSTTSGSNCVPLPASSSWNASAQDRAFRYGRGLVMAWSASATAITRKAPGGYS